MSHKDVEEFALSVPELDGVVSTCRGYYVTVGAKADATDLSVMSL
jgi:hypothetical protein